MRRYALRDDQWSRIEHLLPGRHGSVGVTAADNRLFVEAVLGLGIEVVEIGDVAGGEEGLAHIADGAFDAALLIAARNGNRTRLVTVVPGEAQQRRMEADRVAMPLQDGTFQIVVEQDT